MSVYGFGGKATTLKKMNHKSTILARKTIKESDRATNTRRICSAHRGTAYPPPVSKWSAHLKPIAQRTEIHTNGNQIKWQLKQREADQRACPCVCARACIRVLGKLLLLILGGETWKCYQMGHLAESGFRWDKSSSKKKKKRPGQRDAAKAHQKRQTLPRPSLRMKPHFTTEFWGTLNHVHGDFISHTGFKISINWNASLKKKTKTTDFHTFYGSIICVKLNLICTWTSATTFDQVQVNTVRVCSQKGPHHTSEIGLYKYWKSQTKYYN